MYHRRKVSEHFLGYVNGSVSHAKSKITCSWLSRQLLYRNLLSTLKCVEHRRVKIYANWMQQKNIYIVSGATLEPKERVHSSSRRRHTDTARKCQETLLSLLCCASTQSRHTLRPMAHARAVCDVTRTSSTLDLSNPQNFRATTKSQVKKYFNYVCCVAHSRKCKRRGKKCESNSPHLNCWLRRRRRRHRVLFQHFFVCGCDEIRRRRGRAVRERVERKYENFFSLFLKYTREIREVCKPSRSLIKKEHPSDGQTCSNSLWLTHKFVRFHFFFWFHVVVFAESDCWDNRANWPWRMKIVSRFETLLLLSSVGVLRPSTQCCENLGGKRFTRVIWK